MKKEKNRTESGYRRKPFFRFVKSVLRIFIKKPQIINHNRDGRIDDRAIMVSNHSGASGPLLLELYLEHYFVPWGTYEMNGSLRERWRYLNDVYFTQKKHLPRWVAFLISIPAVFVLRGFYKGIELISTYRDSRLRQTFKESFDRLDRDQTIVIFPENSSEGYKETLEECYAGFAMLSKLYYQSRGIDLPVYPVYVYKKKGVILIGEKQYVGPLFEQGMDKKEVAAHFMNLINKLKDDYLSSLGE